MSTIRTLTATAVRICSGFFLRLKSRKDKKAFLVGGFLFALGATLCVFDLFWLFCDGIFCLSS